jgi:hypothetical protein
MDAKSLVVVAKQVQASHIRGNGTSDVHQGHLLAMPRVR